MQLSEAFGKRLLVQFIKRFEKSGFYWSWSYFLNINLPIFFFYFSSTQFGSRRVAPGIRAKFSRALEFHLTSRVTSRRSAPRREWTLHSKSACGSQGATARMRRWPLKGGCWWTSGTVATSHSRTKLKPNLTPPATSPCSMIPCSHRFSRISWTLASCRCLSFVPGEPQAFSKT